MTQAWLGSGHLRFPEPSSLHHQRGCSDMLQDDVGVRMLQQLAAEIEFLAADQISVDKQKPQGPSRGPIDDPRVPATSGPARHVGSQGGGRELNRANYNPHNAPGPRQQGRRGTSGVCDLGAFGPEVPEEPRWSWWSWAVSRCAWPRPPGRPRPQLGPACPAPR